MSSVTEVKQAPGRWELELIEGTPREIIDALTPFGHIAVAPGKIDVAQVGDNLLTQARYVGVYRGGKVAGEGFSLEGSGMAFWVGDEDGKGPLIETLAVSAATFAGTVTTLLPDAVEVGTLYSVGGSATLTHTFQWETVKSALNFTTRAFSTPTDPVSWRINGDATITAGPDAQLFQTTPSAILVKKNQVLRTGRGFDIIGVSGDLQLEEAFNDYTTKVVVIGQGEGAAVVAASAALAASAILYNDMHGNKVSFTRLVDEFEAEDQIASAVAASLLSRFDSSVLGATLSSDDFDVRGDFVPGDHVAVFAPDVGFVDYSHEIYYEGVPINPSYIQVQGMTWPIVGGFTVGFRTMTGDWLDLSDYYKPSGGQTLIDVGDNPSGLTNLGFDIINRTRLVADASIPATPVFGDFYTSHYLNTAGETRGQVWLSWTQPLNTDSSTVVDGDHYEIRYRPNITAPYPATWGEAAQDTWDELFTWMMPRVPPFENDEWHPVDVPFDQEQAMINDLFPSVIYEFQIRAVDGANPPNRSAWSLSKAFTVARDTLPPGQPAVPSVAGSRLAIQVLHHLGRSEGGTFNLDLDTQYLEVHVSGDPLFFPDASTLAGRLLVSAALISEVPVVGTFAVEEVTERYVRVVAVDREGNRSNASNAVTVTAELIDDAHISDLTASKITAGTITSDLIIGGSIATGTSGQRTELNAYGLQGFDDDGDLTINLSNDPSQSGQYIQFLNDGEVLASIDDYGIAAFQKVFINDAYVGGTHLIDGYVELKARGIVAYGASSVDFGGRGADQYRGYLEVAFDAEAGRTYRITCYGNYESNSSSATERFFFRVYDGGASTPTVDGTSIAEAIFPGVELSTNNSTGHLIALKRCPDDITEGTHRLLWAFKAMNGIATMRAAGDQALFYVEDVGPSSFYENIAVINHGGYYSASDGGGVAPPANPSAVKSYTRTYPCAWSGSYDGDNDLMDVDYVAQGHSTTYGYQYGLLGFPEQVKTDLAGATIYRLHLNMYSQWWSRPSGGTAIVGYHDYLSKPSSISSSHFTEDVERQSNFPKPGSRTISLDSGFHTPLKNGTARGFIIGLDGEGGAVYHGRFDGATQAHPPTMTVTYTK